jgi:diguanylate cyclase (GGDEF)-like protein
MLAARAWAKEAMKIDKPERAGSARSAATAYAQRAAHAVETRPVAPVLPTSAAVLGIPEEEFTPRVRDAVMGLMAEVDRLRNEVEETKRRLVEAARTADQDTLLPIFNRRAFVRELSRFIAFAERYGTPSSLIYFDLNDFKQVNDAYGHAAGDAVLRHFGDILVHQVRDTDVVGRLGGDEFGIILAHVSQEQANRKGESLVRTLRAQPPQWENQPLPLSFSYGVYELHAGVNADAAMAHADEAMYARKNAKR